jgi:hypothetical protein
LVSSLRITPTPDGQLIAIEEKAFDELHFDTIRVVRASLTTGTSSTRVVMPPLTADGFVLAAAPCGAAVMLMRTFSMTPQVFEMTIPANSPPDPIRPLISDAAIALSLAPCCRRTALAHWCMTALYQEGDRSRQRDKCRECGPEGSRRLGDDELLRCRQWSPTAE